jgi:hypothetical protein
VKAPNRKHDVLIYLSADAACLTKNRKPMPGAGPHLQIASGIGVAQLAVWNPKLERLGQRLAAQRVGSGRN